LVDRRHFNRTPGGTSERIIELLRPGALTVDELAVALGLTRTAVRAQLSVLIGRGLVEQQGSRKGPSKPARLFAVTAEAELQLSRAYVPVLSHLLMRLSNRLSRPDFEQLMSEVGRSLGGQRSTGDTLEQRVAGANELLRHLGALTEVTEESDRIVILGQGCPLAAATSRFPETCGIISSLLSEMIGKSVTTRCEEYGRKRCCFEIARGAA
jgi:predicted ArsR family transcriptional regulator